MIGAFALLLAVQSATHPPPPVRAQPRTNLASYVGRADYPDSARAREEEQNVAFQLIVGPDGRVTSCSILGSVATSALANATCRIMRSRARFTPARDEGGNAVADTGIAIIRWTLSGGATAVQPYLPIAARVILPPSAFMASGPSVQPARPRAQLASYVSDDDYPASALKRGEQGRVAFSLDVAADGRVTSCRITRSSGSSALDNATCRIMRSRARYTPALNARGYPVPESDEGVVSWTIPPPRPAPATG